MKKYCTHCGAKLKSSQIDPSAGMPPAGGIGVDPSMDLGGAPGMMPGAPGAPGAPGMPEPEDELNKESKEELRRNILKLLNDENVEDDADEIFYELLRDGWEKDRLLELFDDEDGVEDFIIKVKEEKDGRDPDDTEEGDFGDAPEGEDETPEGTEIEEVEVGN